ncbi:hypothetical protein [Aliiroseovarius sp. F47248L]|uniref:hypothetical protein n=1 Tax=Aliiroseovarius sp. F47248L TaxID=2926420 RepID=UPI001FF4A28B|nr:hypothetical protein [Aliiroseovarius sp. F47248L]MCK0138885.1 hypothetical protein [Aliiroseovarius sp. F47248L]
MSRSDWIDDTATQLADLYGRKFGGKPGGRYRVSAKLLRQVAKRRRLYEDDIRHLSRSLIEKGYVLIDMDVFFVVMSANSFTNYRRANEETLG